MNTSNHQGNGRQDVAAQLDVAGGLGQAQGLDEVALGQIVMPGIQR
ncbi:hypothetical protein [Streptomyces sp. H39-C1]|nr:hypothetical protein [Streptomyces sp. H39-C1]MCZ4098066.1 hypothetical protein [Streptomyces sp. H39-C1]